MFEFSRMWIFHWIKLSWNSWSIWKGLGWLKWLRFFLCKRLSSFNLKGFGCSYTCSNSLCESTASCCTGLITRKLYKFLLKFFSGFTSFRIFLLFPLSITLFVFMHSFSRFWSTHHLISLSLETLTCTIRIG